MERLPISEKYYPVRAGDVPFYHLAQRGYCLGIAFTPYRWDGLRSSKMKAVRRAHGHTSRLKPLVDSVHTIVTFDHFPGSGIPLGGAPRTCRYAGLATYAKGCIHKNYSVLRPFLHGTGGTCRHTPGVFTVETGHEGIGRPGQVSNELWPNGHNLTEPRAYRQILVNFAGDFTTVAADAFLGVLEQIILAHYSPPG